MKKNKNLHRVAQRFHRVTQRNPRNILKLPPFRGAGGQKEATKFIPPYCVDRGAKYFEILKSFRKIVGIFIQLLYT